MTESQTYPMKVILTPEEIQKRVTELAAQISSELHGRELVFLGVLKGAFIFMGDLVRSMTTPLEMDFVRLSSYGSSCNSSGKITMTKNWETDVKGRTVVVVEDIVDTGLTLSWLVGELKNRGAAQVKLCSLINKTERRETPVEIDYVGFHVPQGFLVGYGLDYNEQYRHLAGVYELEISGR